MIQFYISLALFVENQRNSLNCRKRIVVQNNIRLNARFTSEKIFITFCYVFFTMAQDEKISLNKLLNTLQVQMPVSHEIYGTHGLYRRKPNITIIIVRIISVQKCSQFILQFIFQFIFSLIVQNIQTVFKEKLHRCSYFISFFFF